MWQFLWDLRLFPLTLELSFIFCFVICLLPSLHFKPAYIYHWSLMLHYPVCLEGLLLLHSSSCFYLFIQHLPLPFLHAHHTLTPWWWRQYISLTDYTASHSMRWYASQHLLLIFITGYFISLFWPIKVVIFLEVIQRSPHITFPWVQESCTFNQEKF
jgi:hypothetical protein